MYLGEYFERVLSLKNKLFFVVIHIYESECSLHNNIRIFAFLRMHSLELFKN